MENVVEPSLPEHSQVMVFPPVIPLTGFLLGVALEWLLPIRRWVEAPWRTGLRGLGGFLFALGAAGFVWMVLTMKRSRTPIHNSATPTTLVESGPFRLTRNPMYLFGSVAYAGLALFLMYPWSLLFLPAVLAAMHFGVVLREELFLERWFGDEYRLYKARVPRWW
jgi:protein-S-isoprenylcysteine O-methyltransferase Ste14